MPTLTEILRLLPVAVLLWLMIAAGFVFRPDVGRRDPRGLGIAVTLWATLAANRYGAVPPLPVAALGVLILVAGIGLFHWAAFSIRGRVFSYAGNDDIPQFVHTAGPYAYVRNPVYDSYFLVEVSMIVMAPSIWGVLAVVAAAAYFQWLARFEEAKFARSPVAEEYERYKRRTGRMLPKRLAGVRDMTSDRVS
jgi:protein-S-isoprenylcysteine O-methyltransferase Ste14